MDGSSAVMVLNRGAANATVRIPAEDVGDSMHSTYLVRDLWEHRNLTMEVIARPTPRPSRYRQHQDIDTGMHASDYTSSLTLVVPPHGVRMLRMWPVAPPPLAHCPHGYTAHRPSGYWDNTDPCPHHDFHDCQEDSANATVPLCGTKCDDTPGCVAFEVFSAPRSDDGDPNNACYIFLNKLVPPFTPNVNAFTCVRDP